ncbi:MAG: STAS domain-containing protein [Gammaproteobacteria bacterium]
MAAATGMKKTAAPAKSTAAAKKAAVAGKPATAPRRKKAATAEFVADVMRGDEVAAQASVTDTMPADEAGMYEGAVEISAQPEPEFAAAGDEPQAAIVKKGKTMRYLLPANMEIAALGPVHEQLMMLEASNDGPFVLDGSNLSVIDTAGLQLLISFVSAVQNSGKKVSWENYSVQAYQLANELGVVEQLGD